MVRSGVAPPSAVVEIGRLRRHADGVEEADRAGGGRGGAQRLQAILVGAFRHAQHRRHRRARLGAERRAQHGIEGIEVAKLLGESARVEHQPRAAVLVQMQPVAGRAAGDGAAEIEEVAEAVAARAQHRVHEGDRVRLTPGDMGAEARAVAGLIRRAGPGRPRADRLRGHHQAARHGGGRGIELDPAGMQEIEGADVEGGGHRHLGAELHHPLGEMHAAVAVIEAAVEMRALHRHQGSRAHQPRGLRHDAHRHRRGGALGALEERLLLGGESEASCGADQPTCSLRNPRVRSRAVADAVASKLPRSSQLKP